MNNLFLFTGENTYALEKKLTHWKRSFEQKYGDMNIQSFDDVTQRDLPDILTAIESAPFLGEMRMVIVKGLPGSAEAKPKLELESFQEALETSIPDTSLVIFVSPKPDKRTRLCTFLLKKAQVEQFVLLKGAQLRRWVEDQFSNSKKKIDASALDHLIFGCAEDQEHLAQEIEKLLFLPAECLSLKDVDRVTVFSPEAKIFKVLESVGKDPLRSVMKSFDLLVKGGEALPMVFLMIVRQFRLLIQVRYLHEKGASPGEMMKRLKLAPFQVTPLIQQVQRWDLKLLRSAYQRLQRIDEQIKTGEVPFTQEKQGLFQLLLDQFFVSLYEQKS